MTREKLVYKKCIGIIGFGYAGLPLAVEFGNRYFTIGFNMDQRRMKELCEGLDRTGEVSADTLKNAVNFRFANDVEELRGCNFYIVCVPTLINKHKHPDLTQLYKVSQTVGDGSNMSMLTL